MGNSGSKTKSGIVVTSQDEAVLKMKMQRDNLEKYQKRILIVTNREKEIARECLARGDRSRAALALRKKKYQEQILIQTDKQLETLQDLVYLSFSYTPSPHSNIKLDSKCRVCTNSKGRHVWLGARQQGP